MGWHLIFTWITSSDWFGPSVWKLWEDRLGVNISKNFLMQGASQRWDRVAMVHFQCCSDLAGEAVSRGRFSRWLFKSFPSLRFCDSKPFCPAILEGGHQGDPLYSLNLRLHTCKQFLFGQGEGHVWWRVFLERTNFNAHPMTFNKAWSPRQWLPLADEGRDFHQHSSDWPSQRKKSSHEYAWCNVIAAKTSQRVYPSSISPPWRLDKYLRGNRLLISKEVSLHIFLTISIFNKVGY